MTPHARAAGGLGGLAFILAGVAAAGGVNFLFFDQMGAYATDLEHDTDTQVEQEDGVRDVLEQYTLKPSHAIHITYEDWDVYVSYPTRGHNDDVHAADKFNDPRLVGDYWEWVLTHVQVTNTGDVPLDPEDFDVRLSVGDLVSAHQNMGNLILHQKLPDEFDLQNPIQPGETRDGNIGWVFSHDELDTVKDPFFLTRIEDGNSLYLGVTDMTGKVNAG